MFSARYLHKAPSGTCRLSSAGIPSAYTHCHLGSGRKLRLWVCRTRRVSSTVTIESHRNDAVGVNQLLVSAVRTGSSDGRNRFIAICFGENFDADSTLAPPARYSADHGWRILQHLLVRLCRQLSYTRRQSRLLVAPTCMVDHWSILAFTRSFF